jgi:arylformamidase
MHLWFLSLSSATIEKMEGEIAGALEAIHNKFPKAKLIISGHAAGGQLAAHILHKPRKALPPGFYEQWAGLVLISGVYDMRPLVKTYVNEPLRMTT